VVFPPLSRLPFGADCLLNIEFLQRVINRVVFYTLTWQFAEARTLNGCLIVCGMGKGMNFLDCSAIANSNSQRPFTGEGLRGGFLGKLVGHFGVADTEHEGDRSHDNTHCEPQG
jgi:hypothetical protein